MVRGLPNDVFFQVGILTTVGVTARNAILLVEFARALEDQGMELIEATKEAARVRLRPILLTSVAFSMGVVPLAFASGAGATRSEEHTSDLQSLIRTSYAVFCSKKTNN